MYQKTITDRDEGQRLDKYLRKILPEAGSAFLYKMLRKKNITLNNKKADGNEKLKDGDVIKIFFAEETLHKFMGTASRKDEGLCMQSHSTNAEREYHNAYEQLKGVKLLYENSHVVLLEKPSGILSQKAERNDLSLNEWLIGYLLTSRQVSVQELSTFKPSVCNRLDRNTSGIVLCAKTVKGAQLLGDLLQNRTVHKFYQLYVKGKLKEEKKIEGYLCKDERTNKVEVHKEQMSDKDSYIETYYKPIRVEEDKTLMEVELLTGKTHQIRAHLASIGHPLLGDYKYGDSSFNNRYKEKFGISTQLLHAYRVVFPKLEAPFDDLSEREFLSEIPDIYQKL